MPLRRATPPHVSQRWRCSRAGPVFDNAFSFPLIYKKMTGLEKWRETRVKLAVFCFFLLAAFFHLFPLGLHPADSVNEPVDCLLNTWIITWTHLNLAKNPAAIYEANIFYPNRGSLSTSEHLFPLAVLSWPVFLASRNPILSYNFLLFLFITLNGFTMFLLLRHLTGNAWVGIMGGLMFAFNSYQIQHISHLQLQSSWLIPLAFLSLHKFFAGRRLKHSLLFAFLLFLQTLCCVYYGLFMISILLLILPLILLADLKKLNPAFLLKLIAPLLLFGLLTLLFTRPYFSTFKDFHFQRSLAKGTDVVHYLAPSAENRMLGRFLSPLGKYEFFLFPGIAVMIFAGLFLVHKRYLLRRSPAFLQAILWTAAGLALLGAGIILTTGGFEARWGPVRLSLHNAAKPAFLFLAALFLLTFFSFLFTIVKNRPAREDDKNFLITLLGLFWAFFLSFGGYFTILGHSTSALPLPFRWFYNAFPGFKGIRVPSRYAIFVIFALVILAGYGLKAVLAKIKNRAWGLVFCGAVVLFLNAEYLTLPQQRIGLPTPAQIPQTYKWLKEQPGDFPVLELPFHDNIGFDAIYMYFSLFHQKKIVNGYSGFFPPSTWYIRQVFDVFPSMAAIDVLRALGVKYVVLHQDIDRPGKNRRAVRVIQEKFSDALKPIAQYHYSLREQNEATAGFGDDIVFEVLPRPPEEKRVCALQEMSLPEIPSSEWRVHSNINVEELPRLRDGRLDTSWTTPGPQAANDFLQVEFANPQNVGQVALRLENFSQDYAVDLDVEVTEDGLNWKILAGGYSAGEFAWALTRRPGRPLQNLHLEGKAIKALRIVNMRDAPDRPWSVAEMEVYGPCGRK